MADAYVKVTEPPEDSKSDVPSTDRAPSTNRQGTGESKGELLRQTSGSDKERKSESGDKRPGLSKQVSKLTSPKKPKGDKADLDAQTKLFAEKGNIFSVSYAADADTFFGLVNAQGWEILQTVGPVGDCPFLILFLIHSPAHLQMAEECVTKYSKKLIYSEYKQFRQGPEGEDIECPLYYGETALHLAVVNKNEKLVDFLLTVQKELHDAGECKDLDLLSMPALGSFFAPPLEKGPCYYGQVPLGFAACTANKSMCEKLLHQWGADLHFEDTYGNNILHMLALHNLPDMFTYILEEEAKTEQSKQPGYVPLRSRKNKDGDTPLAVAARKGNKEAFGIIVESSKVTVWKYGPIEMIKFPLGELDTLDLKHIDKVRKGGEVEDEPEPHEGTINTLIREGNLELLMQNVLVDILDNKWTRYAFKRYIMRCIKQTILILSVTLALILGFPDPNYYPFDTNSDIATSAFRILFEAIVLFMVITKGWSEFNEMREAGLKDYYGDVGVAFLENALSSSYCTCILIVAIIRAVGVARRAHFIAVEGSNSTSVFGANWDTQGIPGSDPTLLEFNSMVGYTDIFFQFIAVCLVYFYAVTLLLGFRLTGPFVIMVAKMLKGDVTRWSVVFIVMWMGFATTFLALQSVPRVTWMTGWDQMFANMVGLYFILMGNGDLQAFVVDIAVDWASFFDIGSKILIALYAVLMAVMMLNLLIALMMDTYGNIKDDTQIQYMQYKAQIITSLENEMGQKDWEQIQPYWIMDENGMPWLQMQVKNEFFLKEQPVAAPIPVPLAVVEPKKTAAETFAETDANNDGQISKSELGQFELKLRLQVEQELQARYAHLMSARRPAAPQSATAGFVSVNDIKGEGFSHAGQYNPDGM